jgi:probable HAF family extracellular repeat protein
MLLSAPSLFSGLAVLWLVLTGSFGAFAQTQASCTFTLFQLKPSTPNHPETNGVNGVNDFGTAVGEAVFSNTGRGFIRYSGGGVTYYDAPNSVTTLFNGRNNQGVSVGDYRDQLSLSSLSAGFILSGSHFTSFDHPKSVGGTHATGINKYNSVVGWYADANDYGHGFKRWSNGGIINLDYPNTLATFVYGINDQGTVVGSYFDFGAALPHGFIYHGGQWATLDYPNTPGTELSGISNAGVIVGHARTLTSAQSFLYVNGTFKLINVPNSTMTEARGISSGGLIAGITDVNGWHGFTAMCH